MYVGGGGLFGGGAFINNTWQTPGHLFGRGVYLKEGNLFEQIWYGFYSSETILLLKH